MRLALSAAWFVPLAGMLVALAALGLGGCRTARDNQIELLERELRSQEDYIYELEDYVVEYSEKLRECRCSPHGRVIYKDSPSEAEERRRTSGRATAKPKDELPSPRERDSLEPEIPEPDTLDTAPEDLQPLEDAPADLGPEDMEVPDVEIQLDSNGSSSHHESSGLRRQPLVESQQSLDALPTIPDPANFDEDLAVDAADYREAPAETTENPHLRLPDQLLIKHLFRGSSDEGSPSSLLVVIEALDEKQEPVDFKGEVSLMIMTADSDASERLKRWDFSRGEARTAWQSTDLGDGLHLELPLDSVELPAAKLELWARLKVDSATKYLTKLPFTDATLIAVDEHPPSNSATVADDANPLRSPKRKPAAAAQSTDPSKLVVTKASNIEEASSVEPGREKPRWRSARDHGFAPTDFELPGKPSGWTARSEEMLNSQGGGSASTAGKRSSASWSTTR